MFKNVPIFNPIRDNYKRILRTGTIFSNYSDNSFYFSTYSSHASKWVSEILLFYEIIQQIYKPSRDRNKCSLWITVMQTEV